MSEQKFPQGWCREHSLLYLGEMCPKCNSSTTLQEAIEHEKSLQVLEAEKFKKSHPSYVPTRDNGKELADILDNNGLRWTEENLQIAYKHLEQRGLSRLEQCGLGRLEDNTQEDREFLQACGITAD